VSASQRPRTLAAARDACDYASRLQSTGRSVPTSTVLFPLGPFSPALTQPLGLTLRLRGETVAGIEPVITGYCHRGVCELAGGEPLEDALAIVERACSLAHESHRIAVCMAVEKATGGKVAKPAAQTRVLFAEIERIHARFWTLAHVARAFGLNGPMQDALEQRESLFDALKTATGQRHYWGVSVPGGVRGGMDLEPLSAALATLEPALAIWRRIVGPQGALGRAGKGVGVIAAERAEDLGLTGLAARGSRAVADLRFTQKYGAYADLSRKDTERKIDQSGDIAARLVCAVEDIAVSLTLAQTCASALATSSATAAGITPAGSLSGSARVEGPHGPIEATVTLAGGTLASLELHEPGAENLAALPELLEGQSLAQVPALLASLDLCVECRDL
jgi:ech hydrogenase subunit E